MGTGEFTSVHVSSTGMLIPRVRPVSIKLTRLGEYKANSPSREEQLLPGFVVSGRTVFWAHLTDYGLRLPTKKESGIATFVSKPTVPLWVEREPD